MLALIDAISTIVNGEVATITGVIHSRLIAADAAAIHPTAPNGSRARRCRMKRQAIVAVAAQVWRSPRCPAARRQLVWNADPIPLHQRGAPTLGLAISCARGR